MDVNKDIYNNLTDGLYAQVKTTKGEMIIKFHTEEAPVTVANFVGLAQGTIPNKAKALGEPFYNGIIFHRIIKDFMIQGGDPKGTGMGDPGYKFDDEINDLKHTGKGILSMANSGPNTNGSQFFITEIATPWLDGKHTVFAEVVEGLDTVDALANTQTQHDKPVVPVAIEEVNIFSKGDAYNDYDAATIFEEGKGKIKENNKLIMAKKEAEALQALESITEGMEKTESGLYYKITKKGEGIRARQGDLVKVHYAGKLTNGTEFDSSFKRNQPIEIQIGVGQVIKGWDEGILLLNEGDEATFLIPSDLAYGARGAGGVIPPNATLIFDVALVRVK